MSGPVVITEPGVYDLDENDYHADPVPGGSMSSTTARHILGPDGCPALVKWEAEHPVHKDAFDRGTVAHRLILGKGPEIVVPINPKTGDPHTDWRTKDAQEQQEQARQAGKVPILGKHLTEVETMVEAVYSHPRAAELLNPARGIPEQSVFWQDPEFGIWRRAMLDRFPTLDGPGQPIAVDLKTTATTNPAAIRKAVHRFGYHQQDVWYRDACSSAGIDAAFAFIFVAKDPPHLVTVVELDDEALADGDRRNRAAMRRWAECREKGEWPGWGDDIHTIGLPPWAAYDDDIEEFTE